MDGGAKQWTTTTELAQKPKFSSVHLISILILCAMTSMTLKSDCTADGVGV
jgi:hypothetical protein